MGKKSAAKRGSSTSGGDSSPEKNAITTEVQRTQEEGNKHFARKDYTKALEAYDKALKASEAYTDAPLLHSNKAACFMMLQRFKEAVNECSNALDLDPLYAKALVRRAKAYESMGHYKQALTDIQKANKADSANPDTQEAEKRLKDLVSGKNKANGLMATNGLKRGTAKRGQQQVLVYTVKCSLEGETRVLHIIGQASYAELLEQVNLKFPTAPPCALKYLDKEGDLVTITDKNDVAKALDEVQQAADKMAQAGAHSRHSFQQLLPPLRLQLVPVGDASKVPKPPADEVKQLEQMMQARKLLQQQALNNSAKKAEADQQQQTENYEIDQWLIEFANLFRDALGVEPDRHLDLQNFGWEKLQAALDSAVLSEKAPELFGQAADRFQEVTAHGYLQWGNVFFCEAKRVIDRAAAEGRKLAEVASDAEKHFEKAEDRYKECLKTKKDYYDGQLAFANLAFERGKLYSEFAAVGPRPDQPADKQVDVPELPSKEGKSEKEQKEAEEKAKQEANMAVNQVSLRAALKKLTRESLAKGEPYFKETWRIFEESIDALPEEDKNKPLKTPEPGQENQPNPEDDQNIWAHFQVMWGNLLYEYSQMKGAVGQEWKPSLDSAVEKFRAAGCPEADIRSALSSHTKKDEIDLGPEPEPEKPKENGTLEKPVSKPEPTTNPTEAEEKVKGLPSLKPRTKKKAAAGEE